ncbi:MAG: hypothetical protein ACREQH_04400 [Candidatus Binatus sp.]
MARLTFVAGENAPRVFRAMFQPQLEAVADALDSSLARLDDYIASGIVLGSESPMAASAAEVAASFKALDARRDELAILSRPDASPTPVRKPPAQTIASKLFPLDPDALKYATRLGVAIALATWSD